MAGAAQKRWDAARRLFEGEAVSAELIAEMTGRQLASVRAKAKKEGWRAHRGRRTLKDTLMPLIDRLAGEAARIGDIEGDIAPAQVTALAGIFKTIHTIGDLAGAGDGRAERAKENDARLAKVLGRIDDRIEELAQIHAREMLRKGWRGDEAK